MASFATFSTTSFVAFFPAYFTTGRIPMDRYVVGSAAMSNKNDSAPFKSAPC
jgi:hypothetical protein